MSAIFLGTEMEGWAWNNEERGKDLQVTYLLHCPKWSLGFMGVPMELGCWQNAMNWGKDLDGKIFMHYWRRRHRAKYIAGCLQQR